MTNNNSKAIIDTYTSIYTPDLVVANKYATLEQLKKLYTYSNGVELDNAIIDAVASTCVCKRKSDNAWIVLVKWNSDYPDYKVDNKKAYKQNTISHEAAHVAIDVFDYIGQEINVHTHEAFAWFAGWVAECIYRTITKKKK